MPSENTRFLFCLRFKMKFSRSIIILFIPLFLLSGCKKSERINSTIILPEIDEGINAKDISDEDLMHVPSIFVKKLQDFKSYKSVTTGTTVASVIGGKVEQNINAVFIKSDYSYLLNDSHSTMVNTTHTAYFHDQKVVYKNNKKSYVTTSLDSYLNEYGTYPMDIAIEGYTIDAESVIEVFRHTTEESETYLFGILFDREKSTNNVKIQMKAFGGLDREPTFVDNTSVEIEVKKDFTPVSLKLTSRYIAKKILDSTCDQEYTVTYSNFNEEIEIPNLSDVIGKF